MTRRQRGVTMIGWIFLLVPLAIVGYAALRAGPEYFMYYKVVNAMEKTASGLKGDETLNPKSIRDSLDKRFDTGYVDAIDVKDVGVTKGEHGWQMTADYEKTVPVVGNLYLLMQFKKTVVIGN
ncbi:MAG TPA: DUF4845 domain-containing protein [Steroidobacteraceae bacterium]|jgi:Domain of unknown function (DUF4845)|nr:DUF4845 domain-containing protein [Steroidobacteraceae bacterium]